MSCRASGRVIVFAGSPANNQNKGSDQGACLVERGGLGLSMQDSGGWAGLPATTRPPQRCSPRPLRCR
jgi:hypothetical protein